MATTISTQDIVDAKRDIDDIGKAVNENVIVSPRYGEDFRSLPMISAEFQISSDAAEAAAVSAAESAYIAQSSANIAEAAATSVTISAGVFETPEAGVDPVIGVSDGAYYNVRSPDDESYIDEYQNVGGVPTPTGKSYPSAAYVQNVAKHTALPFVNGKTYSLNERVQLSNGDIVKSTVDGNTVDPNVNMTGWLNFEQKQRTKTAEFVTVQDFYSNKTQAYQGATTLASELYATLTQLQADYPFADSLDWSVDALALQAFFNKLQNTRVVKAVCSGEFFSSKPLELKAELTKTLEFNAVLKPIAGFGGGDLLTILTSRHLQMVGNLELWGAVGATAGVSWANRLWNNGVYIIDSTRMTNTLKITPRYFKGWGVLAYSSTYDTVSTNNNMTSFGNIQAQLNGSKAGQWQTTFTNKVNTGSASSTGQRSTLTLSTPVNDVSLVDSNIIYNGELYLITDHSGAQITVFPWLSKTNTTGSLDIIYGGGVKSSGADSNCACFDMIDASDNAVGAHVKAFLGSIINRFVGQFNTIGSQHGNGVINTALYGTWINPYYEGNMFDMYSTSYAPNSDLMLNPNALNLGKCVQLQPRKADLTPDENISRFENSMYLGGKWFINQNNRPDGTNTASTTLSLGDPKKVIRSNTATINLKDDADKRRLWGYTDIEFEIIGNAVNNGTSGVSTIKCDAGYTINGSSSDLVVQPSNSAFRILARLINGSDWSISIFYAEKPSASKTYDPPSLAAGAQQSTTVPVAGATLGNMVVCSFSVPLSGTRMWAEVTAANTVTVYHRNDTSAVVDVPSGTLAVKVI